MSTMPDIELDGQLIQRFVQERDELAFATLVERHGALVAGVCARLLHNRADAEDAFQAVFLVLSRRATAVRRQASLAAWLHGVAVRVCLNERKLSRRRQQRLQEAAEVVREASDTATTDEIRRVLDEELSALPRRLCEVLVLCDLEGRTREEVAQTLSLPKSTVSSRLKRGRELMRKRLARRGLVVAAGGLALAMATTGHAEFVTAALIETTVHNADAFRWGTAAVRASLNTNIVSLAEGVLHAMILAQWKTGVCLVAILTISMFGGALAPNLVPEMLHTAAAGKVFFDDFEDGNATDGSPVTFSRLPLPILHTGGTWQVVEGSLVLTPGGLDELDEIDIEVANENYRDVSIRTRVLAGSGNNFGLFARNTFVNATEPNEFQFWGGVLDGQLTIGYGSIDSNGHLFGRFLGRRQVGWTPSAQEIYVQMDVIDNNLNLTAWLDGTEKPPQPQLSADIGAIRDGNSNPIETGTVGVFVWPSTSPGVPEPQPVAFRFFQASPVPEPSGSTLCAVGGAFLAVGLLAGRHVSQGRPHGVD